MKVHAPAFHIFATLLRYPERGKDALLNIVDRGIQALHHKPRVLLQMSLFRKAIATLSDHEVEELYTQTFDINPAVSLDVGFHLFGLAYKRGDFLVRIQEAHQQHDIDRESELADHLPLLLELATRLPDQDGKALVEECLAAPVARMREGFGPEHRGYGNVLAALDEYFKEHFEAIVYQEENDHEQPIACGG